MNRTKRIFAIILCLMMVLTACITTEQPPKDNGQVENENDKELTYKAGTYTATKTGYGGPLTVEVTVDETTIKDIKLTEFNDTVMVGDQAFETISKEIIENQTLKVDMVSGATISSAAVISAVTDALTQADANIEALQAIEIPKIAPEKTEWETDVIVVGSGISGIAAAIEAAENGADVIIIEMLGRVGGTSALSAGWVHAAGTDIQKSLGIEDSAEKFFTDWLTLAARSDENNVDPEFARYLTEHSAENIQWLIDHGVNMIDPFPAGIYDGRNIPRIHQAEGGKGFIIKGIYESAQNLGVDTHLDTRAMELITEGDNVVGVKAMDKDGNELIYKAKSVILASGGYAGNKEMMAKYHPAVTNYNNSSVNLGDTLIMGESVGADIIFQDALLYNHGRAGVGTSNPNVLNVTPEGVRFHDEADYFYSSTRALREAGFEDAYSIVPTSIYEKNKESIDIEIERGNAFIADTIEELATKMDMEPNVLKSTIDKYNEYASTGVDSDYNKPAEYLLPIEAPYVGVYLIGNLVDTTSSLRINIDAQVINTEGNVIDGLYAAGSAAVAQSYNQEYIGSGAALLNGLTFGRIAGAHAADMLKQ